VSKAPEVLRSQRTDVAVKETVNVLLMFPV
jgi:hypothetical protein